MIILEIQGDKSVSFKIGDKLLIKKNFNDEAFADEILKAIKANSSEYSLRR